MAGLGTNNAEFRDVARLVASVDTLDGFLRDMQTRYPEMKVLPASAPGQPIAGQPHAAEARPRADRLDRAARACRNRCRAGRDFAEPPRPS